MYCYMWEYEVRPEKLAVFETSYGPDGEWARLFRRDPEYVRTILLRDRTSEARFVTIDFWISRDAFLSFRERFEAEFDALDAGFEAWTLRERHIGDFDILD